MTPAEKLAEQIATEEGRDFGQFGEQLTSYVTRRKIFWMERVEKDGTRRVDRVLAAVRDAIAKEIGRELEKAA